MSVAPEHPCPRDTCASCTSHWSDNYIGRPYIPGIQDCASFAARVQREVFNRPIILPADRASGMRGQSRQLMDAIDDYGQVTTSPQEGDAVLMAGRGRLNHIGVLVIIDNVQYVLHAMRDAKQVCLHKLRSLDRIGLSVEGFYTWNTH